MLIESDHFIIVNAVDSFIWIKNSLRWGGGILLRSKALEFVGSGYKHVPWSSSIPKHTDIIIMRSLAKWARIFQSYSILLLASKVYLYSIIVVILIISLSLSWNGNELIFDYGHRIKYCHRYHHRHPYQIDIMRLCSLYERGDCKFDF